jgi:hypothetical protein
MRHLLSVAALLALSAPALACINDTELISHEREFKSQYQDAQYTPPQPETQASTRPYLIGGSGVLLAVGGLFVLLRSRPQV